VPPTPALKNPLKSIRRTLRLLKGDLMPTYALDVTTWDFDSVGAAQAVRNGLWPVLQADHDYANPVVEVQGERSLRVTTTLNTPRR
jgi:hypothetical protein